MSSEEIKLIVDDYMMNLYIRLNVVKNISKKSSLYFLDDLIDSYEFIINNKGKLAYSIEVMLYYKQLNNIECCLNIDETENNEFNPELQLLTRYLLTGIGIYDHIEDEYIRADNPTLPF